MPPSPIPAPLPPWARTLLQVAPFIQAGLQEVLQYIHALNDVSTAPASEWRHVQIVWENTTNTEAADRWVNSLDLVNITNGAVDNSWTDGDYNTVHTQVSGLISSYLALMNSQTHCKEVRYYRRQFNPLSISNPYPPSGPPERIYTVGTAGSISSTNALPRQVAITHTEKTVYPRHWGRSYWPAIASSQVDGPGYIATATVDSWGTSLVTRYAALQAAEFFPVVPVTQIQGAPARGLLQVTGIQVDNVFDIIRRRRASITTHRFQGP